MSIWFDEFGRAFRRLLQRPGFTLAVAASLALGIAANAVIFSAVHGIILSPLPYPEPERLISVRHSAMGLGEGVPDLEMATASYYVFRQFNRTLEEIAVYRLLEVDLTGDGDPMRLEVALATPSLFRVLRVAPHLGRPFDENDGGTGTSVAILSHSLWKERYGGDSGIIGRRILLNETPVEVIGVMPARFLYPSPQTRLWIPQAVTESNARFSFTFDGVARLKDGATPEEAQRDLSNTIPRLLDLFDARNIVQTARLDAVARPLQERIVGDVRLSLWVFMATAGFILLIVCANVANLFLVRAEARRREAAVCRALGAGKGRLMAYFLAEGSLLALAGGAGAVALTLLGNPLLIRMAPPSIPRLHEIAFGWQVAAFIGLIAVLAGLLFGAVPAALQSSSAKMSDSLRSGGRGPGGARSRQYLRHALVIAEVALALIMLVGAGLMIRTYWRATQLDLGFDSSNLLTFEISLPPSLRGSAENTATFHQDLLDRIEALPGVLSAGAVATLPIRDTAWGGFPLRLKDVPLEDGEIAPVVSVNVVAPGYFETMGISLLKGRLPDRSDHEHMTGGVVVSDALVDRLGMKERSLEREVFPTGSSDSLQNWYRVAGVVANVQPRGLGKKPWPIIYLPMVGLEGRNVRSAAAMTYVVRTSIPPLGLADPVRDLVWSISPDLPIARMSTMERIIAQALAPTTFAMLILTVAATVALLLGLIGVYGVISYLVTQRLGEIGVRMALGADARRVNRMVLKQGAGLAAMGAVLGVLGALALSRFLEALLFEVSPVDGSTYLLGSALLFALSLLAAAVPARRAAGVDPAAILKMS